MKKLAKYLKPFLFGLVLAVALLFVQAVSDLSLPDYMSDIVNTGLQQSGIEHAAPDAISQDGMAFMTALMDDSGRELVLGSYALVSPGDVDAKGKPYSDTYPDAQGSFYVRTEENSKALDELDLTFGTAVWTLMNLSEAQGGDGSSGLLSSDGISQLDITALYGFTPMLSQIPADMINDAHEKALANDESTLRQSGVVLAKAFLGELGVNLEDTQRAYILRIGLMMLGVALIGGVATVLVSFLSSRIAAGVGRKLRSDLFKKIESFSTAEFDQFSTATLITRCTNDVTQVQQLIGMGIRMICYAPIMGIGGVLMAVRKSPSMSWVIAVACVVLLGLILIIMALALPRFKAIQKLIDRLNLVSRENLSGLMVIRAFGTQKHEQARFAKANGDLTQTNLFVQRIMALMSPIMTLIMNGTTLLIIWVGAKQIAASSMQVGDMMAFMQYAMQIIMSFLMISMMFIFVPRAAVSADRIAQVLYTEPSIKDPAQPKDFVPAQKGVVEFKDVHFRYAGAEEDALNGISFTALPGQTTAIIGPTGSGKSTLLNLILRFYDVTQGEVAVEGVDVRDAALSPLRARIGYVPQKGVLLSGTIASNLRYGSPDATDEHLKTVAQVAQAADFIEEKPDGYESEISQGGTNVSGGQKQRLSIARALAKDPTIFLFDDSFSALDFKTDAQLRAALNKHTGDSTVLIVAQRVSTILNADQILVMDGGKIVGRGTHKELLATCPEYYEIASSQLAKEELA